MKGALLLALAACGGGTTERPLTFGGDRPVDLQPPAELADGQRYPLLLVLHGYSVNGFIQEAYLGIKPLAETSQAFVLAPDGLTDSTNRTYWNADPVCCDFDGANPDDSGYLRGLLDDVEGAWPVDRDRVFVVGHANGGYMAYRMACDHADVISAIVVIAGGTDLDCEPAAPVSVLHMHGTDDQEFLFDGGGPFQRSPGSPGAVESVSRWAAHDGCGPTRSSAGPAIDLDSIVDGPETIPEKFDCPPADGGIDVELWTMQGTEHLPGMTDTFVPVVWPWLMDHARP